MSQWQLSLRQQNPPGNLGPRDHQDHQDRVAQQEKMELMEAEGVLAPKDLAALRELKERLVREAQEDHRELLDRLAQEDPKDPAD